MLSDSQQQKALPLAMNFEEELFTSQTLSEEQDQADAYENPAFWMDIFPDFIFQDLLVATENSLVWRGTLKGSQTKIALKITENFQNETSKSVHQKWEKTFFRSHSLTHTVNIISVVDKEQYRLVAMELYPWTLETVAVKLTNKHKRFDVQHITFVSFAFKSILTAVEELHSHGYVHRDLKLDNFMVDQQFHVLLNDLELVTKQNEVDSSLSGTLDYMAPERMSKAKRTAPVRKSLDVWSLGIILYQLLIGDTPFHGDTPDELSNDIYSRQAYNKYIPAEWNTLIQGMLQIRPENRLTLQQVKENRLFSGEFDTSLLTKLMKK